MGVVESGSGLLSSVVWVGGPRWRDNKLHASAEIGSAIRQVLSRMQVGAAQELEEWSRRAGDLCSVEAG
jgi:hypothetical protein